MKRLFAIILTCSLMLLCASAYSVEFPNLAEYSLDELIQLQQNIAEEAQSRIQEKTASPDKDFLYVSNGEETRINLYQGKGGKIVVPDELGGTPVTSLGDNAFDGVRAPSITLPNSISHIGDYCFSGTHISCILVLPSSLTHAGTRFCWNSDFTGLVIQSGVRLTESAFWGDEALRFIYIRDGSNPSFRGCTFYKCENLETVVIPSSVTSISDNCFELCPKVQIVTPKGSYAEEYARKNFIPCETETYQEYVLMYESLYFGV